MREVLDELAGWYAAGKTTGVATVVGTWQSAPRQPGATMLVGPDGRAVGGVSGGCVEGAVYELAARVRDGGDAVLQRYGVSDDDAFAVGLTCGGTVDVFVEPVSATGFPEFAAVVDDVRAGRPVAVATLIAGTGHRAAPRTGRGRHLVIRPDSVAGTLGSARLDDAVRDDARGLLRAGTTATLHYGPDGERRGAGTSVFVATHAPRPRLIVFGAIDFAAAVARVGALLGFRITVCDARPTFATDARFPAVDEVVVAWPHRYLADTPTDERTVVCVLTHDPKFDVPLLEIALRMPLAYVGAMGSRRTNDERLALLRARGLADHELARLRAPMGLDLGARTAEETAVSIMAEIVAARWGGSGVPLRAATGPIHQSRSDR